NIDPVEYQKVVSDEKVTPERKELSPEEFDTSEPFTDDTDEVEFDVADYEYDEELRRGASRYHDDEVLRRVKKMVAKLTKKEAVKYLYSLEGKGCDVDGVYGLIIA